MVAQGNDNKLTDELLTDIEISITPCKLTESVKVDLHRLSDGFIKFLVLNKYLPDEVNNDVQMLPLSKIPKFCQTIRDAFRAYNMRQNADV